MSFHFGEVVQNFELKRVGGAPKGHPLAPLFIIERLAKLLYDCHEYLLLPMMN